MPSAIHYALVCGDPSSAHVLEERRHTALPPQLCPCGMVGEGFSHQYQRLRSSQFSLGSLLLVALGRYGTRSHPQSPRCCRALLPRAFIRISLRSVPLLVVVVYRAVLKKTYYDHLYTTSYQVRKHKTNKKVKLS